MRLGLLMYTLHVPCEFASHSGVRILRWAVIVHASVYSEDYQVSSLHVAVHANARFEIFS